MNIRLLDIRTKRLLLTLTGAGFSLGFDNMAQLMLEAEKQDKLGNGYHIGVVVEIDEIERFIPLQVDDEFL